MEYKFPIPPIISKCLSCHFINFSLFWLMCSPRRVDSFQPGITRWQQGCVVDVIYGYYGYANALYRPLCIAPSLHPDGLQGKCHSFCKCTERNYLHYHFNITHSDTHSRASNAGFTSLVPSTVLQHQSFFSQ